MASCCTSDCPVQYGYCPQNKSTAQITDFQLQLDELKIVFYLVLERYRESYNDIETHIHFILPK